VSLSQPLFLLSVFCQVENLQHQQHASKQASAEEKAKQIDGKLCTTFGKVLLAANLYF
jgi:hypothetical protein